MRRQFFVVVYEKTGFLVKLAARSAEKDLVLKRYNELRIEFPEALYRIILGGTVASWDGLQNALPHLRGWDQAVKEEV